MNYLLIFGAMALVLASCSNDSVSPAAPRCATLTFEDADYCGAANYLGIADWSSLIAEDEATDPLLYGEIPYQSSTDYCWYDEGNTELRHRLPENYGMFSYSGGGIAISNHSLITSEVVTYANQLSIPHEGGHSGSNFAVCYIDNQANLDTAKRPSLRFSDGRAHIIESMQVIMTSYTLSSTQHGGFSAQPYGEGDFLKIIATGYAADGSTSTCEFMLAEGGDKRTTEWTEWNLASLGAVVEINFHMVEAQQTSYDGGNTYYYNTPLYFAFDDVKVTM